MAHSVTRCPTRRSRSSGLAACIVTGVKADGKGVFDRKRPAKARSLPWRDRKFTGAGRGSVSVSLPIRGVRENDPPRWVTKYDAECCKSRVDEIGRWPIGYCSPECIRRPK